MTPEQLQVLLLRSDLSGIYRLPAESIASVRQIAEVLDFASFQVDLARVHTQTGALKSLGHDLDFPAWYGANLDALNDCLTDFSWRKAPGYVVIFTSAHRLHALGEPFLRIKDVFENAIETWREQGFPFWIFLDLQTAGVPDLPNPA